MPSLPAPTAAVPRPRLDYLDGLRGLAALYVVLHHAFIEGTWRAGALSPAAIRATDWLIHGRLAVDVFIVLSGYCLMLPIARDPEGRLRGGVGGFFARRARRILPPYYAILLLALLLTVVVPGLHGGQPSFWLHATRPPYGADVLLSHLILAHNLRPDWSLRIDYPLWSVATEWQIYFLFPLLLLPLWRRFGLVVLVGTALALGLAPHWLWWGRLDCASFEFIGLFALGMAGAAVNFAPGPDAGQWQERVPWGPAALLLWAMVLGNVFHVPLHLLGRHLALFGVVSVLIVAAVEWRQAGWGMPRGAILVALPVSFRLLALFHRQWISYDLGDDIMAGVATASLLVFCTQSLMRPSPVRPTILRVLGAPAVVGLGVWSYSLYLVHAPILALVYLAVPLRTPSWMALFVMETAGVSLALLASYGFHRLFERPFLPGHPRTEREAVRATIISPAP